MEWASNETYAWLWEIYDTFRLCYLLPVLIGAIRDLDMTETLGGAEKEQDFRELLDIFHGFDWNDPQLVPLANSRRKAHPALGRRHPQYGDWFYYDPWEGEGTTAAVSCAHRRAPQYIPYVHSWVFCSTRYGQWTTSTNTLGEQRGIGATSTPWAK